MKTLAPLPFAALLSAGLAHAAPAASAGGAPAAEASIPAIAVSVSNPLAVARAKETIALSIAELRKLATGFDGRKAIVTDKAGKEVLSQLVDMDGDEQHDEIVFQTDLGAKETKTFKVKSGERKPATREQYKTYGRFVRERYDDFAWENDLVAHRVYGPALETHPKEALTSSGIDTWVKRVSKLIVNDWYMTGNYHKDMGEGADYYAVKTSRGCGGIGVWVGGKLHVSRNFTTSRVLASGPIRLVFELGYAPWDAGGSKIAETKRVILDAGSPWNRMESTLSGAKGSVAVGIGIAKHPDSKVTVADSAMQVWEPLDGGKGGNLGTGVVVPGAKLEEHHSDLDYLVVAQAPANGRLVYYVGSAWDKAGKVRDAAAWSKEVQSLTTRLAEPVKVELAIGK